MTNRECGRPWLAMTSARRRMVLLLLAPALYIHGVMLGFADSSHEHEVDLQADPYVCLFT